MKRLALLATATFMAFLLSSCGDNAEKKVESKSETSVEKSNDGTTTTTTTESSTEKAASDANKPE